MGAQNGATLRNCGGQNAADRNRILHAVPLAAARGLMAQELLTTFPTEIGELALVPGTGGIFEVPVDRDVVWSRADHGRFPEIKELKQLVRDRIALDRDLGHSAR